MNPANEESPFNSRQSAPKQLLRNSLRLYVFEGIGAGVINRRCMFSHLRLKRPYAIQFVFCVLGDSILIQLSRSVSKGVDVHLT